MKKKKQSGGADRTAGQNAGNVGAGNEIVARFVHFQNTGKGFDRVWMDLKPVVNECAGMSLVKLGVLDGYEADPWAKDDVVSLTVLKLQELAKPNAGGRFDPSRAQPGFSGLKGWLSKVVNSQAVNWVRDHRCGRSVKFKTETDLIRNVLPSGDESTCFFDRLVAKIERPDLLPILNACIEKLPPDLARLVRLRLDKDLSHRDTAAVVGFSAPVVGRRLKDAYVLLRNWLEEAGFDEAWLAA